MTNNTLGNFGKPKVPDTPNAIGRKRISYEDIEREIELFYTVYKKCL
jgi:hypothetical protein